MTRLAGSITIRGEIRSTDNLTIDGLVEGPIWSDGAAVTIGPTAVITGDIVARTITVLGTVTGSIVASEAVAIRATGTVNGRVVSSRFSLEEGGVFTGAVQPQHLHAALQVARHRQDTSDETSSVVATMTDPPAPNVTHVM